MRKSWFSRAFCVSLGVWTVLCLFLQFSPAFMHTQTLRNSDFDGAPGTTTAVQLLAKPTTDIPTQTEETVSDTETEKTADAQTENAQPLTGAPIVMTQTVAPTGENLCEKTDYTAQQTEVQTSIDSQTGPAPIPTQTKEKTPIVDASQANPTLPQEEGSSAAIHTESATLPVAPVQTVADSGETGSLRPLRFGAEVSVSLPSEGSGIVYIMTVTERGNIQYTLTCPKGSPFSTVGWKVTMYEEYTRLGDSGGKAYRRLNILNSSTATAAVTSAAIGVQPGTYRLVLEQNGDFSRDEVTLLANFTAETNREIEPNDIPERYTHLYPGHAMIAASGKYESSSVTDEDWYLFRMPYDGHAYYTFSHEAMDMVSVGWQIYLYDRDLNQLSFNNAELAQDAVTGERIGLGEGIYFLCVKGRVHSTQNYTVMVETEQADLFEQESNDTAANATPIESGKVYSGMMNNRSQNIDYDYFRIRVDKPGSLTLTFSHEALEEQNPGWNISLLDADGTVLYSDVSYWSDTVILSPEMGVAAGDYYVRIDSDNRYINSAVYTVQVDHVSDRSFEAEPNNTPEKASPLYANSTVKGSLTQGNLANDTDYFVLSLTADSQVNLTFSHEKVNMDRAGWKITLTDADGKVYTPFDKNGLPYTDTDGTVRNFLLSNWNSEETDGNFRLPAGDYYVCVEAADWFSNKTYSLHASVQKSH